MDYILIPWPESQELMEYEDFDKHSSLAEYDSSGPSAYFVEKEWLKEIGYLK